MMIKQMYVTTFRLNVLLVIISCAATLNAIPNEPVQPCVKKVQLTGTYDLPEFKGSLDVNEAVMTKIGNALKNVEVSIAPNDALRALLAGGTKVEGKIMIDPETIDSVAIKFVAGVAFGASVYAAGTSGIGAAKHYDALPADKKEFGMQGKFALIGLAIAIVAARVLFWPSPKNTPSKPLEPNSNPQSSPLLKPNLSTPAQPPLTQQPTEKN